MSEKMRKAVGREFDRLDGVMNRLNAVRAARQYADSAGIPLVAKEHIRGLALLLESVLAEQPAISCAAIRTLQHFGYSYHGGALWKPPIGERPTRLAEKPAQGELVAVVDDITDDGPELRYLLPVRVGMTLYTTPPAPSVPDEVAKDAARYRFIRSAACQLHCIYFTSFGERFNLAGEDLDHSIDAAMLAAAEPRS